MTDRPDTPPVGRELDRAVAKALGCRVRGTPEHPRCGCDQNRHNDPEWPSDLAFYSTDLEAAWEVIEALSMPDGVSFGVLRMFDGEWEAYTYSEDGGLDVEAEAPTAPEAICRAALKAVEEK